MAEIVALSANAARALDQAKMSLLMLYGAGYFADDEWVKVDGLIHKGKYVFTSGPQQNLLEEQHGELMSFNDAIETVDITVRTLPTDSSSTVTPDTMADPQADFPIESDCTESTDSAAESPNDTSIEASSDDEQAAPKVEETDPNMFDFSQWDTPAPKEPTESRESIQPTESTESAVELTEPAESAKVDEPEEEPIVVTAILKREPAAIPAAGGLALYSQAQLDEMKAFNAGLTKAGKKGKPKYNRQASPSRSRSQTDVASDHAPTVYAPTPSEYEGRIQSWADEVQDQEDANAAASPVPSTASVVIRPSKVIVNEFIKTHGRVPSSTNEVVQPNNPQFVPLGNRPAFRAVSTRPHPKAPASHFGALTPHPNVKAGTILIAQCKQDKKKGSILLEIDPGDSIRVVKHVSGITHLGTNLRSGQTAQFSEAIFKKAPGGKPVPAPFQHNRRTPSISTALNGLDGIENSNAAEWDEVSVVSRSSRSRPFVAPAAPKPVGGSGASRFAVLADGAKSVSAVSDQTEVIQMSREDIDRMFDEKIAEILAQQANGNKPMPTGPARKKISMNEPLMPVTPKSQTCWFWATPNKDCRFTSEECRDLHLFLPGGGQPTLHKGRPTWGALVDQIPAPNRAQIQAQIGPYKSSPASPSVATVYGNGNIVSHGSAGEAIFNATSKASKTCWYWANRNTCQNTAEQCKYLHEYCAAGIAPMPSWVPKAAWSRWDNNSSAGEAPDEFGKSTSDAPWRSAASASVAETAEEGNDSELVLETVADTSPTKWLEFDEDDPKGWGTSAQKELDPSEIPVVHVSTNMGWGDEGYKSQHIRALEEKAQIAAVGW